MKLIWLGRGISGNAASGFRSSLASNRYRAIIPALELRRLGYDADVVDVPAWSQLNLPSLGSEDVVVVAKFLPFESAARTTMEGQALLARVTRWKNAGQLVIADFCDDHFSDDQLGSTWRALAAAASVCTSGTEEMAQRVTAQTGAPVIVIGDPVGSELGQPQAFRQLGLAEKLMRSALTSARKHRLRFAWYGDVSNFPPLQRWVQSLIPLASRQPWWLGVVTRRHDGVDRFVNEFNARHGAAAQIEFFDWSEETQSSVVAGAHIVLVPSDPADSRKAVKTSNRVVDAIHAGRHVIASPLPSYRPFEDFVDLAEDPVEAVLQHVNRPDAVVERIKRGQAAVASLAAPEVIARRWLETVSAARAVTGADERSARSGASPSAGGSITPDAERVREPVRLNLGCGDKILPGFINVDVVEARAGMRPDVICDLHQLTPFPDDYADEIMAVHVVEHFWRWEVEAVLREWVRVLRPGGRMVLECPNLRSACETFLANPVAGSRGDLDGQRTMWVFYGDPRWKDPLMVHRWGYTPESLALLMASVGLENPRQQPAQYKLREPRDMRVVAEKPAK